MMINGKQIKVIKRAERHEPQAALSEKSEAVVQNSGEMAKRDAVTVVTEWVRELRHKKVEEAAHGFKSLFREAA
jgi:hypothetical protein